MWKQMVVFIFGLLLWAPMAYADPVEDLEEAEWLQAQGDFEGAKNRYKVLAEAGNARAQAKYAAQMDMAEWVDQAFKWYKKSAEQGDPDGQYGLATMYFKGRGVAKNPETAMEWVGKALAQEQMAALQFMSNVYAKGLYGFEKNTEESAKLRERLKVLQAAERNLATEKYKRAKERWLARLAQKANVDASPAAPETPTAAAVSTAPAVTDQ